MDSPDRLPDEVRDVEMKLQKLPQYRPSKDLATTAMRRATRSASAPIPWFRPALAAAAILLVAVGIWHFRPAEQPPVMAAPSVPEGLDVQPRLASMQDRLDGLRPGARRPAPWQDPSSSTTRARVRRAQDRLDDIRGWWGVSHQPPEEGTHNTRRRNV